MAINNSKITTTGKLGTYHMVGLDSYEPQRTNNFELQVVLNEALQNKLKQVGITDYQEYLSLSVDSMAAPSVSNGELTIDRGNNTIKYAGRPTFDSRSITFNDYIGLDTEKMLEVWRSLVYNKETQEIGYASEYKQQAYLIELTTKGTVRNSWLMKGCWPSSFAPGDFDNKSNNVRQITMTLTYDWCTLITNNALR